MRSIFKSRKRLFVALTAIAALAIAGAAFAYFTSTGSGTSQAAVGSASNWGVTFGTVTGTMYPGQGSTTIPYTVTNNGSGNQQFSGTTASVASKNGDITQNGVELAGCLASWFQTSNTSPAAADLAPASTATGSVAVSMVDAATSQNVCQGATPDIVVSAS